MKNNGKSYTENLETCCFEIKTDVFYENDEYINLINVFSIR